MFTTTYTINGTQYTREWPDHVQAVILGSHEDLLRWMRDASSQRYMSGGVEYSALLQRMRDDLKKHPEWEGCWVRGTPEHDAHIVAKSTPEYKVFAMISKALLAIERRNGWKFLQADPHCRKCGGTGYLQQYSHVSQGVCFSCFPG